MTPVVKNPLRIINKAGATLIVERQPDADGCWLFSLTSRDDVLIGNGILSDIVAVMKTIAGHCGGMVVRQ